MPQPFEVLPERLPADLCGLLVGSAANGSYNRLGHWCSTLTKPLLPVALGALPVPPATQVLAAATKAYEVGVGMAAHTDRDLAEEVAAFSVQLCDPNDYEGGDLIVGGEAMPRDLGTVVLIDGDCLHEVTPVRSGVRWSLVVALVAA